MLLTDAVALAAGRKDDRYPNYVAEGLWLQEKELVEKVSLLRGQENSPE